MLAALPETEDLDRLLDAAEALSGYDLRALETLGKVEDLADTRISQPLLYLADWAWGTAFLDAGLDPVAVAGHSLGEFAALAVAGVYSVEAGLELVVERSRLMASAAAAVGGGMAAVIGLDSAAIRESISEIDEVWVANDNTPGQVVVSGSHAGIDEATEAIVAAGARRVILLDVSGPFHTPLMDAARDAFLGILEDAAFSDARIPVVQNTDPTPATDAARLKQRLTTQMTSAVRWTETMSSLVELGAEVLVEAGPGAVLKGLAKRAGIEAIAVEEVGMGPVLEEAVG
jgi:[acyl-carrier-protein] S-malonyltransferase